MLRCGAFPEQQIRMGLLPYMCPDTLTVLLPAWWLQPRHRSLRGLRCPLHPSEGPATPVPDLGTFHPQVPSGLF